MWSFNSQQKHSQHINWDVRTFVQYLSEGVKPVKLPNQNSRNIPVSMFFVNNCTRLKILNGWTGLPKLHKFSTHWCQLEDMFQSIVMPRGIEKVTIQLLDTPTKVYAIGARLFFIKGAPRSASKFEPINSHTSYIGKSTGPNKRSVPINRTVSFNWNQRVVT